MRPDDSNDDSQTAQPRGPRGVRRRVFLKRAGFGAAGLGLVGTAATTEAGSAASQVATGPTFETYPGVQVSTADFPDSPSTSDSGEATEGGSEELERVPFGEPGTAAARTVRQTLNDLTTDRGQDVAVPNDYDGFGVDDTRRTVSGQSFTVIPGDPQVGTGVGKHVSVINSEFGIFDKATGAREKHIRLEDFFDNVRSQPPGGFFDPDGFIVFDPRVRYDRAEDRFIVLTVEFNFNDGTGAFLLSVSDDGDPFGTWTNYRIPPLDNVGLVDFPTLGFNDDAVALSQNFFAPGFVGSTMVFLDKADLYAGRDVDAAHFTDLRNPDGSLAFTVQPAAQPALGGDTETLYLLNSRFFHGSTLTVWEVADPAGSPSVSNASVGVRPYNNPVTANQPDTEDTIDTIDSRLTRVAFDNADGNLWSAHAIDDAAVRWYEVDPAGPSLVQSGEFKRSGTATFMPTLETNGESTMVVYNVSSGKDGSTGTDFPRVEAAGRTADFDSGRMESFEVVKEGESQYDITESGDDPGKDDSGVEVARWGDYNGISIDPVTGSYWVIAQYASNPDVVDEYTTRIGEVEFDT